jgi:uncharacterized membrane protein
MINTNTTKTQHRKLKRPTRTPQKHNTESSKDDQHEHHKNTTQKATQKMTNTSSFELSVLCFCGVRVGFLSFLCCVFVVFVLVIF